MKPILYEKNETAFTSSGIGRLADCLECKVSHELGSGLWECDFDYPVTGVLYDEIILGRVIAVTHDDTGTIEPFDITAVSRPINGVVSFHAVHVSYRLTKYITSGTNIVSNFAALAMFRRAVPSPIPFTFQNSLPLIGGTMGMGDGVPRNVREMIGGGEGSFLDTYGGEVSWSGFTVSFQSRIGQQRDFIIRYGVNMMNYTEEQDGSECYTMAVPYWKGNDTVVVGNLVDSGLTPYNRPTAVALDLSSSFEEEPTTADLEAKALQIMQSGQTNLPSRTINVDFVRLQDLEDYAGFTDLMTCELGDSIEVVFPMYGMQGVFRIVKVVWDVLRDRFESMTLGSLETTLAEALGISGGMTNVGSGGGGGGSVVQFTQVLSSGTRIGVITIDGAATDIFAPQGGDTVTWTQSLATGTKIAEISINGTSTDVYAPSGGGGAKTAWFGTCPTAENVAAKVVTTSSGDFSLTAGSIVFVKFTNRLYTANTTLNVDGTGAVTIKQNGGAPLLTMWVAGETVGFAYDGTNFEMIDRAAASTTDYGLVKLSSSVSDSVVNVAANSYAVKQAYDLANSKSEVSWTQAQTSGTKIGEINIDGTIIDVYAPAGGGGSYTATAPIDITNNVISHNNSGVGSAGYTTAYYDSKNGYYIPLVEYDSMGHLTGIVNTMGTLIPLNTSTSGSTNPVVLSQYSWALGLRSSINTGYTLSAGNTTQTQTISSDSYSVYSYRSKFRVADVQAYDMTTFEPVIVDWKCDKVFSAGGTITVTISIAQAYSHDIRWFPILTYATASM